jgi:hypothetical protein
MHKPFAPFAPQRPVMPARSRLATGLLAAAALLISGHALAQTSYTLHTLKPGATNKPLSREQDFFIDATHRVTARSQRDAGFRSPICIPFLGLYCDAGGRTYSSDVLTWPPSTASTVSPIALTNKRQSDTTRIPATSASPSGRIFLTEDVGLICDTQTGAIMAFDSQFKDSVVTYDAQGNDVSSDLASSFATVGRRGLDDAGHLAVNGVRRSYVLDLSARLGATTDASLNTPIQLPPPLPVGTDAESRVRVMASVNLLAGEVRPDPASYFDDSLDLGNGRTVNPALWVNGRLQVIDRKQGRAIGVNQAGQVLLQRANKVYSVWFNGQETAVAPLVNGEVVVPHAINASGVVVGRSGLPAGNYPDVDGYRNGKAFIWRNGVSSNLNQWVASKGLKLPSGSVLEDALDINDAGSIVAVLKSSGGTRSVVRLQAKP